MAGKRKSAGGAGGDVKAARTGNFKRLATNELEAMPHIPKMTTWCFDCMPDTAFIFETSYNSVLM